MICEVNIVSQKLFWLMPTTKSNCLQKARRDLALSTHRELLLQMWLPFGIKSTTGYFQEILEQLIGDLCGATVYTDNILVSGNNVQDYPEIFRALFEMGLHCNHE